MTSLQRFIPVSAIALAILIGAATIASAQATVPSVTGTATSVGTVVVPGATGSIVSNVTLSFNQAGSVFVSSVPVTVTAGNGASVSNLSSCQIFNANGAALNTGANVLTSVQGSNTITFDTPLQVTGGTTSNLTVRCNIAVGTPATGTFQFAIGTPTFAPALSVTTPMLTVTGATTAGAQDVILANILLDAMRSGADIRLSSLPVTITASGGGSVSNLSDCRVRNSLTGNAALNSGVNVAGSLANGTNTITFDNTLTVAQGTALLLSVTCDVSAAASVGSTFQIGTIPGTIGATAANTGAAVVPTGTVAGTLTSAGVPVVVLAATTPGVPNTGEGGNAPLNMALLALSALAAILGVSFLRRFA